MRPRIDPWVGKTPWRRKWQPAAVLLLGKSHGWRSLVGYSPWDCKESDTTEQGHWAMPRCWSWYLVHFPSGQASSHGQEAVIRTPGLSSASLVTACQPQEEHSFPRILLPGSGGTDRFLLLKHWFFVPRAQTGDKGPETRKGGGRWGCWLQRVSSVDHQRCEDLPGSG